MRISALSGGNERGCQPISPRVRACAKLLNGVGFVLVISNSRLLLSGPCSSASFDGILWVVACCQVSHGIRQMPDLY